MDVPLREYVKKLDHSYVFGVYPTIELLEKKPEKVAKVLLSPRGKVNGGVSRIENLCKKHNIKIEWSDGLLIKVGATENALAVGVFMKFQEKLKDLNHLVLVNPSDAGNLGTIIRTASAFGIRDIAVIKPAVDLFDPKTVRASMGSLFSTRIEYFDTFDDYRKVYKRKYYAFMLDGEKKLGEVKFERPFSLIFGNEGAGLTEDYKNVGTSVVIEQSQEVDSLNLSIAVGVAVYVATK